MISAARFVIVLVTAPDLKTARMVANSALRARLVACANLVSGIESHYWWQGKLETSAEILIIFKTQKARLVALEKLILAKHPYDTPEILALPLNAGARSYLEWIEGSVSISPSRA
ncbi:MAG TPA: divalent-cation tolerance protein CutA [Verrucomicrobiae bacterium]|jgi:periplasmic divalent cation tolerance protein